MSTKAKIYGFIEAILPPFVFKIVRHSALYSMTVGLLRRLSPQPAPEICSITSGTLSGFKLKLDPKGSWQQQMLSDTYDVEIFSYLKSLPLSGKVMYDIGAHICYHSLMFATFVGKTGQVVAFEPNPVNVARAKEILALNSEITDRIAVHNVALSNTSGNTEFLSSNDLEGGTSTGGFIDNASTLWARSDYIEKTGFTKSNVALETIDSLVDSGTIPPPDVLKIDVEGAEQLVIEGAHTTIKKYHPHIIVEFHSIFSTYASMELLTAHGYSSQLLKHEIDGRVLIASTYRGSGHTIQ